MIRERLEAYAEKNSAAKRRTFPDHILFYRDGVSESQFGMVRTEELPQIREACKEVGANCKITLVVVGKRHHARFYPVKDGPTKSECNVKAGSVVQSVVTAPRQFSFYLQSHDSPIGTARTAHYVVLENESGYTETQLQQVVSVTEYLSPFRYSVDKWTCPIII